MKRKSLNHWTRWLHLYLSMFSFGVLLFFAATGITLNHPAWTEKQQKVERLRGTIDTAWVAGEDTASVGKSKIVEYLQDQHRIRGHLSEFRVDDNECSISFNGPGYTAFGLIERSTGSYELIITSAGFIGTINDMHKGYETGNKWNAIIDITAGFLIIVSLTGFIMIFFITKRRTKGLWVAILGVFTFILVCLIFGAS